MYKEDTELNKMRHTAAHVMAAAIQSLWPKTKFGVGPVTENGFYYDVLTENPLTQKDLNRIEKRMKKIMNSKLPVIREDVQIDDALKYMKENGQELKVDLINLLKTKGTTAVKEETGDSSIVDNENAGVDSVSLYTVGKFVDLCRGPHVEQTDMIGAFRLQSISAAYWRGDQKKQSLQRIYGVLFRNEEELENELWKIEQAKLRDHRKIGKELEIFAFTQEIGAGLPLWLPNGTALRDELEFLARSFERKLGYKRVVTPEITKEDLFYRSQHLPYYADDMYAPIKIEEDNYFIRPMNCPFHHKIYDVRPRSYRELPLRLAEYGTVYRYENSGSLSGLMRTRNFCQNDAHIYCTYDQAEDEFLKVMHLHAEYYKMFGIEDFYMRLSLPDLDQLDKYVDQPEAWLGALKIIRSAMEKSGYPYREAKGEAAFYGPKVDFMIKSVVGTEYAISTNQLDFLTTETFDLTYTAEDGKSHPVYVIHRAPLGSHERFVAFLIEHYAGAFPVWLAPIQVRIIPITDKHLEYAEKLHSELSSLSVPLSSGVVRAEVDSSNERMQKKIRQAQLEKIPYMLVVGDREAESNSVSIRKCDGTDLGSFTFENFKERISLECINRKDHADL